MVRSAAIDGPSTCDLRPAAGAINFVPDNRAALPSGTESTPIEH